MPLFQCRQFNKVQQIFKMPKQLPAGLIPTGSQASSRCALGHALRFSRALDAFFSRITAQASSYMF